MKKFNPFLLPAFLVFTLFMLISCEAFDVIFKAGVWIGLLIILAIVSLIVFFSTRKFYRKS